LCPRILRIFLPLHQTLKLKFIDYQTHALMFYTPQAGKFSDRKRMVRIEQIQGFILGCANCAG